MPEHCYVIAPVKLPPEGRRLWDGPSWGQVLALPIDRFHPQSSEHRPIVRAKMQHDDEALHLLFDVQDRYVIATHQGYQRPVYQDSCVECFLEPLPGRGYLNFEVNCIGALLVHHVIHPDIPQSKGHVVLPESLLRQVRVFHSLAGPIVQEIREVVAWQVEMSVPWSFFDVAIGAQVPRGTGAIWRGNLYKCADGSSHPHWASWVPIGRQLNFHCPQYFGSLHFQ